MRLMRDQDGGPLVEAAILIPFLFVFLLGSVDLLNAFNQWNQATKAVEVGARIAAVSDPVSNGLTNLPNAVVNVATCPTSPSETCQYGDPMPSFQITCDGKAGTCNCTGTCTGITSGTTDYDAAAMNLIVFGRDGKGKCGDTTSYYTTGMCDVFPTITASNVKVVYAQTGLGYAGRVVGPVPTITVSLQGLPFQFFFLNGLLGFLNVTMPALTTTITGEALSSASQ
jgi:Flp pilus assembly protein TadG